MNNTSVMTLNFDIRPIGHDLDSKVFNAALDPLNSIPNRKEEDGFTVQLIRNVKFSCPRYVCAAEGETVRIYFMEGSGGLIFSVSDVSSSSREEENGYLTAGEYVEFKSEFSCLITLACTSPVNYIVLWME